MNEMKKLKMKVEEGEGETAHTIVLKGQIPVDVSLDRDQFSFCRLLQIQKYLEHNAATL